MFKATRLISVVREICAAAGPHFAAAFDAGLPFHLRINNPPYNPLVLELLSTSPPRIAITQRSLSETRTQGTRCCTLTVESTKPEAKRAGIRVLAACPECPLNLR